MLTDSVKNRAKAGARVYLIMIGIVIIMSLLLSLFKAGRILNVLSAIALSELIFTAPVLVLLLEDRFEVLKGMNLKFIGIYTILWTMLFSVLLIPMGTFLNLLTQIIVPNSTVQTFISLSRIPVLLGIIYYAVLPAIAEEYLFRGVFYQYFRPYGLWKTALVTGLLFGLAHLNLNQFLYGFAIGAFLVFLEDATGSVFSCMLAHTILNAANIIMVYVQRMNLPENMTSTMVEAQSKASSVSSIGTIYWIIMGVVAVGGAILAVAVMRKIATSCGREKILSDAAKGRDIRNNRPSGKFFSVELILSIIIPFAYMGIMLIVNR